MRTSERAFTLIELMVVVTILGLLVAIVGPNVFRSSDAATRRAAEVQMAQIASAAGLYTVEHRRLPASLDDLTSPGREGEPYLDRLPKDPWGSAYEYRVTDAAHRRFEVVSAGPDRIMGTEDDLHWPAEAEGRFGSRGDVVVARLVPGPR